MPYEQGQFGHAADGRRLRVLDSYTEARQAAINDGQPLKLGEEILMGAEAMSTSDFPTYIGSFLRHSFLGRYTEVSGNWSQYTRNFAVEDFEEYTASRFGRFPDWPEKTLNGEYEQLAVRELPGPTYRLKEWGAAFSLTRQLILSDRLGEIQRLPRIFAEAAARTVSKRAVAQIEGNPVMWDGVALFHATHANIGTTALTADIAGANAIKAAMDAIDAQLDPEGYKVVNATANYTLLIPRALRWIANAIQTQPTLPLDVTSGTSLQRTNEVQGRFSIIEEPYFTDTNNWYMGTDFSGDTGFLANVTLNGNTTPFVGLRDPAVRGVFGGDDPYSFDFDEVDYKGRHDFDFVPIEYRSIYGSIVT